MRRAVFLVGLISVACGGSDFSAPSKRVTVVGGAAAGEAPTRGGHEHVSTAGHAGADVMAEAGGGSGGDSEAAGAGGVGVLPNGGAGMPSDPGGAAGERQVVVLGGAGAGGQGGGAEAGDGGAAGSGGTVTEILDPWRYCDDETCAVSEVCAHDTTTHRACMPIKDQFGHCDPSNKVNPDGPVWDCCKNNNQPVACSVPYYSCGLIDDPATGESCGGYCWDSGKRWSCGPPLAN